MTSSPTYRAVRVREADLKANGYTVDVDVDVEVDGQEHQFFVQPNSGTVQTPSALQHHESVELLNLAAAKALQDHLSGQKDNPSG